MTQTKNEKLDKLIRETRPRMSVRQVAAAVGVSHQTLYNLLEGKAPQQSTALAIAKFFDVDDVRDVFSEYVPGR